MTAGVGDLRRANVILAGYVTPNGSPMASLPYAELLELGAHFHHETFGERTLLERIFQEIIRPIY